MSRIFPWSYAYQLKKLIEIGAYLLDKVDITERLAKKMNSFSAITSVVDTGLLSSKVITGGVSIAAFASDVGLSVGLH